MDIKSIFFGIAIGMTFTVLSMLFIIYFSNRQFIRRCLKNEAVSDQIVQQIIKEKQKEVMLSPRLGFVNNFQRIQFIIKELVHELAVYYYPDSKYPELEISIFEGLELTRQVAERLQSILAHKLTSPIKHLRLSQIMMILDVKKSIENNKLYQFSKKYKLEKFVKYGYTALNITNPFYWTRKLIFTSTLESTLRGFGVLAVQIVGEESSRLYEHRLFIEPDPTVTEIDQFLQSIQPFEVE